MATNLFVSLYHFFFVFHDVGYTQKIKKDERDFISFFFAGYIYTRFALFSGSTTHKRSLGLCLCFFFLLICIATGHWILNIYKILKKLERLCRAQPNFGGPPPPGTRWGAGS